MKDRFNNSFRKSDDLTNRELSVVVNGTEDSIAYQRAMGVVLGVDPSHNIDDSLPVEQVLYRTITAARYLG